MVGAPAQARIGQPELLPAGRRGEQQEGGWAGTVQLGDSQAPPTCCWEGL